MGIGHLDKHKIEKSEHTTNLIPLNAWIPSMALSRGSRSNARIPSSSNDRPTDNRFR